MNIIDLKIIKGNKRTSVIPYNTIFCRDPDKTIFILDNGLGAALRKSVVYIVPCGSMALSEIYI
jgi:hypothetical protein